MAQTLIYLLGLGIISSSSASAMTTSQSCDTAEHGYVCQPEISRQWGQYSPYFSVPSKISPAIPATCTVTFAQLLSRHGSRDPSASKTTSYNATISKIKAASGNLVGRYAFLSDYEYVLGADQLNAFGQQQMINSGAKFYERYQALARKHVPFVRTSSEARVLESAQNWTQGFSLQAENTSASGFPEINVIISEADGSNNTLNHGLCTSFEDSRGSGISNDAQATFADLFIPTIQARLSVALGVNLTQSETVHMMDLCPFSTVASTTGQISEFCGLFTTEEWKSYGYYESLNKFYGFGSGNPLGPTQGVGFANELIARLTNKSVVDHTSTNHTLDGASTTFPLGRQMYADFSHDDDLTAIFFALGLYNSTEPLPITSVETTERTNGYSASYTVPFGARAYFEKLQCVGHPEELVRVIVNDRVLPLHACDGDCLGRCTLSAFVDSLAFVRAGGNWEQCFI